MPTSTESIMAAPAEPVARQAVSSLEGEAGALVRGSKGERTRQAILHAAVEQFAHLGLRGVSVPALARSVDLSPSAVYAYFPTKADLYAAAVDADVAGLLQDALPEVLAGRFDGDFAAVFRRLVRYLRRHPLARRILGGDDEGAERLAILPIEVQLRRGIATAIAAGQVDGSMRRDIDPEIMAAGLEAVVIALLMASLQIGTQVDADQLRGVMAVLDAALRPST